MAGRWSWLPPSDAVRLHARLRLAANAVRIIDGLRLCLRGPRCLEGAQAFA